MTAAENLNKTRAAFMRRASAPNVNPFALKLAYIIAYKYLNAETATARPSQETLACDLGCDPRTVQRMLDILRPLGLVVAPGHGPNRANTSDREWDLFVRAKHLFDPAMVCMWVARVPGGHRKVLEGETI